MELQERKMKILQAIIRNYLETGEPVGSRTISKYTDLNLSSATIRNEMSDLEEMGLITQPHTSAGRIPTDQGYRVYVDDMLRDEKKKLSNMQSVLLEKQDRLENLLQDVAKLLAVNTKYASMISAPEIRQNILAVIVIEGNVVRNTMIRVNDVLDQKTLFRLNMILNNALCGIPVEAVNLGTIASIKKQAGEHDEIIENVINAAAQAVRPDDNPKIYTSGATNILRYPELAGDTTQMGELISNFEEKEALGSLVQETLSESGENGIQVYIGNEMPMNGMQNCSVVTATYDLGEGMKGTVGVIGPKRMDYDRVIGVMQEIMKQLDTLYKK